MVSSKPKFRILSQHIKNAFNLNIFFVLQLFAIAAAALDDVSDRICANVLTTPSGHHVTETAR